jgi:hypothetical protein
MSTLLLFNIYFVTADNRSLPLQFVEDLNRPNQGTLTINQGSSYKPALFVLDDQPDFLQRNNGVYLGATYAPKIQLNHQKYYLSQINNELYTLKSTRDDNTFSFSLLNPKTNWDTPDPIVHLHLNNLSLPNNVQIIGYYFYHQPPFNTQQPLVFSPIDCDQSVTICGPQVCPENFSISDAKCKPTQVGAEIPIGIRTNQGIYTYKIINGKLIAAVAHPSVVTAGIETNNTVRERLFYVSPSPGDNKLIIGKSYPIYVMVDGNKIYLNDPITSSNIVTYTLTRVPGARVSKFTPTQLISPRTNVKSDQFQNFIVPNESTFTIWSFEDEPIVHSGNLVSKIENAAIKAENTAVKIENAIPKAVNGIANGSININKSSSNINPQYNPVRRIDILGSGKTPPVNQPSTSLWKEWWFWISVIGLFIIIFLVGWGIYYLLNHNQFINVPSTTGVSSNPKVISRTQTARPLPPPRININNA